ncbi:PLP-dependent cysteine synthase family protein [Desulfovibrio desulfuricans]|nr:cysteine synthase family protein [Desulfovibrio desulfuricans]
MHLSERIGNTPLIFLEHISHMIGGRVFIKYEVCNPFGSALDRTAFSYLQQGINTGELKPDGCIIESSTGNLAISLAYLCAAQRVTLLVVMPEPEDDRIPNLLRLLRAQVTFTPRNQGMAAAAKVASNMHIDTWNSYYSDQFHNNEGPQTHYRSTGKEIVDQCNELAIQPDIFIAGVGSGATFMGVGSRLREAFPSIQLVAVEPAESPVLSGGKSAPHAFHGIGAGFIPDIFNYKLDPKIFPVCIEDAVRASRRILNKEGLPCGLTTGANLYAALQLVGRPEYRGKNIIIMGHDGIERDLGVKMLGAGQF